jgi:hypothetical protein
MDTRWFAVDERGAVAVFYTGENGPLPFDGAEQRQAWLAVYHALHPRRPLQGIADWYASRGVAHYDYSDSPDSLIRLYERTLEPAAPPLHLDQLPLVVRRQCRSVCFVGADFGRDAALQPLEFIDCRVYADGVQIAYVCGDGVTVRPRADHQDEFADFVANYRERHPDRAAKFRFDGETG